jgi:hypothetical protein
VEAWLADIAQRPASKCGTSLAVRGEPGTGKTKIGEYLQSVFGAAHFIKVADPRYVTGRFNSHLASCLILHADEGFWAGDRAAEGKLKDLITGADHWLEYKGKEAFRVDNYVRLLVTGNPDWVVPAALGERRFAVTEIGTGHQEDHDYFAAIDDEMRNGGSEALLYHLLYEVDCKAVNLRKIPETAALFEQKVASMTPEQAWWLGILMRGVLPGDYEGTGVAAAAVCRIRRLRRLDAARRRAVAVAVALLAMTGASPMPTAFEAPMFDHCGRRVDRPGGVARAAITSASRCGSPTAASRRCTAPESSI